MIRTVCINFSLKKSKILNNGTAPVYLRLTVAGERVEFTTCRYIKPDRWNPEYSDNAHFCACPSNSC
jgi:hypothetical protein